MKRIVISDPAPYVRMIEDEIDRSQEGRYFRRLHIMLDLLLRGVSSYEAARLHGLSPRTVEYWLHRLLAAGPSGLRQVKPPGRPSRLPAEERERLTDDVRRSPRELGYDRDVWDCSLLADHLRGRYAVPFSVRQCRRLLGELAPAVPKPPSGGPVRPNSSADRGQMPGATTPASRLQTPLAGNGAITPPRQDGLHSTRTTQVNESASTLRRSAIFSDLDRELCARVSRGATTVHVEAGRFLYLEGDRVECLYLITKGRIKILVHSPSGKDFVMAFHGPGELLGSVSFFVGTAPPCSAQAQIDTEVLAIKNDDFLSFLLNSGASAFEILRRMLVDLGRRYTNALIRLKELAVENADHRLAHVLFVLSSEFGLTLPFTREEVAEMAGTTTETAVRFMNRLNKLDILRLARRKTIILDRTRLASLIGGYPDTRTR